MRFSPLLRSAHGLIKHESIINTFIRDGSNVLLPVSTDISYPWLVFETKNRKKPFCECVEMIPVTWGAVVPFTCWPKQENRVRGTQNNTQTSWCNSVVKGQQMPTITSTKQARWAYFHKVLAARTCPGLPIIVEREVWRERSSSALYLSLLSLYVTPSPSRSLSHPSWQCSDLQAVCWNTSRL